MPDEKLSVVIGMPEGYWKLFDEETTARLLDPHPNVVVETSRDSGNFNKKSVTGRRCDGRSVWDSQRGAAPRFTAPLGTLYPCGNR